MNPEKTIKFNKVLFLTFFYNLKSISGENIVYREEYNALSKNPKIKMIGLEFVKTVWIFKVLSQVFTLNKVIKNFNPDVIYVNNFSPLPSAWILLFFFKKKIILLHHSSRFFCPKGIPIKNKQICSRCVKNQFAFVNTHCFSLKSFIHFITITFPLSLLKNRINRHIVLNGFMKNQANILFGKNKVIKIPNLIKPKEIIKSNKRSTNKINIVWAGRGDWQKGFQLLLLLNFKFKERFVLNLCGNLKSDFIEKLNSSQSGLEINYKGILTHDELLTTLSESHILLFTSRIYEGYPTILVEGLQLGLHCFAPKMIGTQDFPNNTIIHYDNILELNKLIDDIAERKKLSKNIDQIKIMRSNFININKSKIELITNDIT
jgi:glycosyltransferase involved in cell wall biosynthesis